MNVVRLEIMNQRAVLRDVIALYTRARPYDARGYVARAMEGKTNGRRASSTVRSV